MALLYLLSYNSINGARGGVRTRDTQIKSLVLYQLSYTSIAKEVIADTNQWKLLSHSFYMVRIVGLEPTRLASADFKSASSAYSDISASNFKTLLSELNRIAYSFCRRIVYTKLNCCCSVFLYQPYIYIISNFFKVFKLMARRVGFEPTLL